MAGELSELSEAPVCCTMRCCIACPWLWGRGVCECTQGQCPKDHLGAVTSLTAAREEMYAGAQWHRYLGAAAKTLAVKRGICFTLMLPSLSLAPCSAASVTVRRHWNLDTLYSSPESS